MLLMIKKMRIGKVIASNITEKGDIVKPNINYHDKRKFYQPVPFWSGFIMGIIGSVIASFIYGWLQNVM